MKTESLIGATLLAVTLATTFADEGVLTNVALIPEPLKLELREGSFGLGDQTVVAADGAAGAEGKALAACLRASTGLPVPVKSQAPRDHVIELSLDPRLAATLGSEGYRLSISPSRVEIRASGEAGLFYGGVTFRQLLPPRFIGRSKSDGGALAASAPCAFIEDRPRFAWRGLLLDCARHFMPIEFIKKLVDVMAVHKLNSLQLHLTDDQGWRLEMKGYPRLTQVGSVRRESPRRGKADQGDGIPYGPFFYTQEQVRDLVRYARDRHVTIVPEIEMPGHFRGALASYPELSCTGGPFEVRTRWGVEPDILCAGNDQAVAFARNVLAEVIEMFPSRFIHIGGDEAPRDRWKECPKCQARMKAHGLAKEAQLQTWFNSQIDQFLQSRGRRLIGWDEILEGGLTPGAAVMSWRGTEGGIAAAEAGHDVVMSPTSHCYFDYAQAEGPGEPESIGGLITLAQVHAFDPVPPRLSADKRRYILGAQGNVWTEFIHIPAEVEYFAFPRAVALAEVVWSPAPLRSFEDFTQRLGHHLKRLDALGVAYRGSSRLGKP